ncbi:MAG: DUF504 domain-containing protein [Thaumarchaeota archaeon]|nr:DUF504 domain-containing protein [Nitrososphaerota archaeon]MCL5318040.1 DUF504 domain-containing protein [Nitrososphaerota archaeon]
MKGRKGVLEEVLSRALHADDPGKYSVVYREFNRAREVGLLEFLELSENFTTVPASRIILVKKEGSEVLYRTSRSDLLKLLGENTFT